ncbi:hypothetical protein JXJ21_09395 [candidate division KSB1 bacterium]|nr:hypothetical protein [candidate division KSB1 bacterium]
MKTLMKQLIFLGITLLIACPVMPQISLEKKGDIFRSSSTHTFKVEPNGLLRIKSVGGDVKVITWEKKSIEIREFCDLHVLTEAEANKIMEQYQSSYSKVGNTVRIEREPVRTESVRSRFEINMPRVFNLDISTIGGDIAVRDVQGTVDLATAGGDLNLNQIVGDVTANTAGGIISLHTCTGTAKLTSAGGDIDVSKIKGPVQLKTAGGGISASTVDSHLIAKTAGGSIRIRDVKGNATISTAGGGIGIVNCAGTLEAKTAGGDIDAQNIGSYTDLKTAAGEINASTIEIGIRAATSGGDIELNDIRGYVEAETSAGNIEAKITLKDFSKDHHVSMKTTAGNLRLYLPENLPATIEASIAQDRGWSDYSIISDFPLSYSEEANKEGKTKSWNISRGEINGGGDRISLETQNGDIRILKLK